MTSSGEPFELDVHPDPDPVEAAVLADAVRRAAEEDGLLAGPAAYRSRWRAAGAPELVEPLGPPL